MPENDSSDDLINFKYAPFSWVDVELFCTPKPKDGQKLAAHRPHPYSVPFFIATLRISYKNIKC